MYWWACVLDIRLKRCLLLCLGLSIKTQELYVIVFCSRYVDLFVYKVSLYNTCMKIAFIGSALFIVYVMRYKRPYCSVIINISHVNMCRLMMPLLIASLILSISFLEPFFLLFALIMDSRVIPTNLQIFTFSFFSMGY